MEYWGPASPSVAEKFETVAKPAETKVEAISAEAKKPAPKPTAQEQAQWVDCPPAPIQFTGGMGF